MAVGIMVAMPEEAKSVIHLMKNQTIKQVKDIQWILGTIGETEVVLVECKVGKVHSARMTQMMLDLYEIDLVLNIGSAGSLIEDLTFGDTVLADSLVQYDFDISAFNHKKGYIPQIGEEIRISHTLLEKYIQKIKRILPEEKVQVGRIATGDQFVTEGSIKNWIYQEFQAVCVEMEGASIAQVCYLNEVPCMVIRSISDTPNGNNAGTHEQYLELVSKKCAKIVKAMLEEKM